MMPARPGVALTPPQFRTEANAVRIEALILDQGRPVAGLTAADRATLLTFDHTVSLGPRDTTPDALAPRLQALTPQGQTSLVDAVTTALVWGDGARAADAGVRLQRRRGLRE